MSLAITYLPLFLPPPGTRAPAAEAPQPAILT